MSDVITEILTPANLATAFITINFLAFAAFGIDKMKAEAGAWRITEARLLQLAFFGGTLGAYAGRAAFRHKTRKKPFCRRLHTIAVIQLLGIGAVVGWVAGGWLTGG